MGEYGLECGNALGGQAAVQLIHARHLPAKLGFDLHSRLHFDHQAARHIITASGRAGVFAVIAFVERRIGVGGDAFGGIIALRAKARRLYLARAAG